MCSSDLARDGGLVVMLPDASLARLPYVLPYVRPGDRCSVPPSAELALSRAIWQLNRQFFAELSGVIRVVDTAPAFGAFCRYVGFAPDMAMVDVCDWHLARLVEAA